MYGETFKVYYVLLWHFHFQIFTIYYYGIFIFDLFFLCNFHYLQKLLVFVWTQSKWKNSSEITILLCYIYFWLILLIQFYYLQINLLSFCRYHLHGKIQVEITILEPKILLIFTLKKCKKDWWKRGKKDFGILNIKLLWPMQHAVLVQSVR